MKVYEDLARLLRAGGVDTVFGVMGDGNMHWLAAYLALPGARWYPAWHEAGAVGMADGYATAAALRRPAAAAVGVATVTMGPGVAQSLAALTAAARTRSRVLVVTAEAPQTVPPNPQDAGQLAWTTAAGAAYRLVTGPADLAPALAETLASARAGRPAVLAVPAAMMTAEQAEQAPDLAAPGTAGLPPPDPAAVRALAGWLSASERPLIVLGRGAVLGAAVPAAVELGRRAGAGFLTTIQAKGCLAPYRDPYDLGLTGTMAHPPARTVAATTDAVLVIGAALDRHNTGGGSFFGGAALARIDCRPAAELWHPGGEVLDVRADAGAALTQLADCLAGLRRSGLRTQQTRDLLATEPDRRARLAAAVPGDGLNPWAVIAAVDDAVDDEAHIVTGVGHFWYFAAPYLSAGRSRTFQFGHGFGLIGQGVPLGTGAAMAAGGRGVVTIEGDGSFLMNAQEIQSAVRFGADLLLIVLNNEAYGSEYHKLGIAGLDPAAGTFSQPADITALARALGAEARRVTTMPDLRAGLAEFAGQRSGVRVLEVMIARSVMSEAYERMHRPAGSAPLR